MVLRIRRPRITRRRLVAEAAGFGAGVLVLPGISARAYAANEKLNLALVGCGSRGGNLLESFQRIGENIVALCDANHQQRAAKTFQKAPDVPKHFDYRKMLEENGRRIDAVLVATTDHHHAPCAALAMKLGKPVYCEKPLTLTVQEARAIRRIAQQAGVATQMGNQGTATDAFREQVELLQTGGLGEVRDVYVWCRLSNVGIRPLPTDSETPPPTLAWDRLVGSARGQAIQSPLGVLGHVARLRHRATGQLGCARLGGDVPRAEAGYPVGCPAGHRAVAANPRAAPLGRDQRPLFPHVGDHRLRVSRPGRYAAGDAALVQR